VNDSAAARQPGSEPLGRLLSQEANVANLLGYLTELDPAPLLHALRLKADKPGLVQESPAGRSGRIDAFVTDSGHSIALVELKVGASEHGDQFSRYEALAAKRGDLPCHLVSLDEKTADVPAGWEHHLLPDLLAGWRDSSSEVARVLARELERALRDVLGQAAGPLGQAGRTAIAVAFRQLAHQVRSLATDVSPSGAAERTSGGQPSVVFYIEHPLGQSRYERLCVDLRSEAKRDTCWKLRLGVEVRLDNASDVPHEAAVAAAQVRAHDLALGLRQTLQTSAFVAHLRDMGEVELADSLQGGGIDGLVQPLDQQAVGAWRNAAQAGHLRRRGRKLERHPLFFHDRGRRLTSISYLDYKPLTASQLAALVTEALRYLQEAARQP
jgi:hypothetical protein